MNRSSLPESRREVKSPQPPDPSGPGIFYVHLFHGCIMITIGGKNDGYMVVDHGGCKYGGYTLTTTKDREGNPLTIIQSSDLPHLNFYMPFIVY